MSQKIQSTTILGIETSCDETAVSIVHFDGENVSVLSNIVSSQIQLHAQYGGVVPNLAAREHTKNMMPVLEEAFAKAELSHKDIDAIAVTQGPGLIPALLVGTTTARTLSYLWQKPLLGIHHIEGHIYANAITHSQFPISNFQFPNKIQNSDTSIFHFPVLALVVSGGHTQLVLMKEHFTYEIIGETQDDAVGEAFDKVARILNLGYPGGPAVSQRAAKVTELPGYQVTREHTEENSKSENANFPASPAGRQIPNSKFSSPSPVTRNLSSASPLSPVTCHLSPALPRPMFHSPDFNFSFSGLKTAVLYAVQKFRKENKLAEENPLPDAFINALCKEFQQAAIDVLVKKTIRSAKEHNVKTVILAGGVSANTELRNQIKSSFSLFLPTVTCHLSPITYSTDNAAMIASAGALRWSHMTEQEKKETKENWRTLKTFANLSLR